MGFFNDLKTSLSKIISDAEQDIRRYKNKDVLDALMASCALIAAADGYVSPEEKRKMVGFVQSSPITKIYDTDEAIKLFNAHADRLQFDFALGKVEILRVVGKQRENIDVARLIIRTAIIIGSTDGDFSPAEKHATIDLCRELNQDPTAFDLVFSAPPTPRALSATPTPSQIAPPTTTGSFGSLPTRKLS